MIVNKVYIMFRNTLDDVLYYALIFQTYPKPPQYIYSIVRCLDFANTSTATTG